MLALDVARIEAGLMLIDVDYVPARKALIESQTSSPYELDLGWAVNLEEGALRRQARRSPPRRARGPQWQFVGIEIDWSSLERLYAEVGLATRLPQAAWRTSVPIYAGNEQAGYATSGGWSPLLKKYIALAHLRSSWAAPGTKLEIEITVEHRRKRAAARVVKKPFFDPERKRRDASYDVIIIGGGHNGLVCAAYLARAGQQGAGPRAARARRRRGDDARRCSPASASRCSRTW